MTKARFSLLFVFLSSLLCFCASQALAQAFNHPGTLNSEKDLAFIKEQVANKQSPWTNAWNKLTGSKYANLGYNYQAYDVVKCGSYNKPNVGCNNMVEDGMAAYTMALRWYVSDDKRYADKAVAIVDAWARKYRDNTESNSRLVVSWAAPWYVGAAEILRYMPGSGWTDGHTTRMNQMLDRFKKHIFWEGRPNNNWMMSSVEARLSIAVFQDDKKAFDAAVEKWKFRIRTYIYQKSDGPKPVNGTDVNSDLTRQLWLNRRNVRLDYVDGVAMETCRDANHLKLGFNSIMNGAEIAWQQGIDLFELEKKRIGDFLELHGSWMTGGNVPNSICNGDIDWKGTKSGAQAAFEIAYNHLHDRLGMALPHTKKMIDNRRPNTASRWVTKWETFSYAGRTFTDDPVIGIDFPPNVFFVTPAGDLELPAPYSLTVEVEASDPDGELDNVLLYIDDEPVRPETSPPYEWGHDGSPMPNELNQLAPGIYTIKAVATDKTGLINDANFQLTVTGDPEPNTSSSSSSASSSSSSSSTSTGSSSGSGGEEVAAALNWLFYLVTLSFSVVLYSRRLRGVKVWEKSL